VPADEPIAAFKAAMDADFNTPGALAVRCWPSRGEMFETSVAQYQPLRNRAPRQDGSKRASRGC
jgi:hypothetical protein